VKSLMLAVILIASTAYAHVNWSYPIAPYWGEVHETEYPSDNFPTHVRGVGPVYAGRALLRMGDPDSNWTYWPYPSYYWWDALTGSGVVHGSWQSTGAAVSLFGTVEFQFASKVETIRIRTVGDNGKLYINGDRVRGFEREDSKEDDQCRIYASTYNSSWYDCKIYQAVVDVDPTTFLYIESEGASILKVSGTYIAQSTQPRREEEEEKEEDKDDDDDDDDDDIDFDAIDNKEECEAAGGKWKHEDDGDECDD
jgi:hypothetical protein